MRFISPSLLGVELGNHPLAKKLVRGVVIDQSGGTYVHESKRNIVCTLNGNYSWINGYGAGLRVGQSSGGYISIPDADDLSFGNASKDSPFSLFFYGRFTVINTYHFLITKYYDTSPFDGEYDLEVLSDGKVYAQLLDNSPVNRIRITSSTILSINIFYTILLTYDGSGSQNGLNLYINGAKELNPTRAVEGTYVAMHPNIANVEIGNGLRGYDPSYYVNGVICAAYIFNSELIESEAQELTYDPWCLYKRTPIWMFDYTAGENYVDLSLICETEAENIFDITRLRNLSFEALSEAEINTYITRVRELFLLTTVEAEIITNILRLRNLLFQTLSEAEINTILSKKVGLNLTCESEAEVNMNLSRIVSLLMTVLSEAEITMLLSLEMIEYARLTGEISVLNRLVGEIVKSNQIIGEISVLNRLTGEITKLNQLTGEIRKLTDIEGSIN